MTGEEKRSFFLQRIDSLCGIALSEVYIGDLDVAVLSGAVGIDEKLLRSPGGYVLNDTNLSNLKAISGEIEEKYVSGSANEPYIVLTSWSKDDELPYRLHPPRELILMERREKPLSVFLHISPRDDDVIDAERMLFDPFIRKGLFVRMEVRSDLKIKTPSSIKLNGFKNSVLSLYSLSSQSWRIESYLMIKSLADQIGWSEPLTRLEGTLLGYSQAENDAFINGIMRGRYHYCPANS